MTCGPRNEAETCTESDMTEGTEETINDPEEVPSKRCISRAADKALALLLPDKGPRSMDISTV